MKKIILIGIISLFFAVSCEQVEEPYIEGNPFTGVYDSDLPIKKILIEDFTGINCPNCPRADEEIKKLKERYGGHIVAIAIHAGWFATPYGEDPDYRTDVGFELGGDGITLGYFHVQEQPIGLINRKQYDGESKVEYQSWSNKVVEILSENKFADIDVNIENTFFEEKDSLNTSVFVKGITDVNAKLSLSVYLIENKIISKQNNGSEVTSDYEHNHVLRAGINGTWGDEISTEIPFKKGKEVEKKFSFTLNNTWVADNCEVVAFVYNSDTKEAIQAEVKHVVSE
ncbi:MAG: Omp28 family outer membrane lipoprotein [Chlorobi bacterium]|nr:Omp28 family outer membrane lipoprotein [Chlorobiota bacterium]